MDDNQPPTPEQITQATNLIRGSTLTPVDQDRVIALLPHMSPHKVHNIIFVAAHPLMLNDLLHTIV